MHILKQCPLVDKMSPFQQNILPLDEEVASRAVFVIVSGLDGLAETLWSQLR